MINVVCWATWIGGFVLAVYWLWPRPRPVHRWAELDSADVATAIRRVRRPR